MSDPAYDLRAWERKAIAGLLGLLITVFGVWAGVVYHSTQQLVMRLDNMAAQLAQYRLEEIENRSLLERRITLIEQRQEWLGETVRELYGPRRGR